MKVQVIIKKKTLEGYSLQRFINTWFDVVDVTRNTPKNHVNVDISHNPEGGLNINAKDIKCIRTVPSLD